MMQKVGINTRCSFCYQHSFELTQTELVEITFFSRINTFLMMEKIKFLILLCGLIGAVQCGCGNEEAYLTPFIESGNLAGGKAKATVSAPELPGGMKSYSGYLTVNKTCNSNMFFWFFPAQKNPDNAPVVLWLQGGPGASSLYGLFIENGPVLINSKNKLDSRLYSWTKDHNVLYIDNPGKLSTFWHD